MTGVTLVLFEIAMDEMYNEVRFVSDDQQMTHTFDQLKHPDISPRVQQIHIRPDFLPGAEEYAQLERSASREIPKTSSPAPAPKIRVLDCVALHDLRRPWNI
ncbi:hypothetical protein LshimejAT787_1201350 [Lyophyllum shimeji]|uniref:Uncharacterized protein n=1 Tax=Lyophyllum shimeji TaxID=47721 RepID=A0A9P3UTZ8_LYOSH|nr:hypothetical protein LshimejAT787_1201350 [Lyophyllum shimeji]